MFPRVRGEVYFHSIIVECPVCHFRFVCEDDGYDGSQQEKFTCPQCNQVIVVTGVEEVE